MNALSQIKQEFERRVYQESFQRIKKCVDLLNDYELWQRPNDKLVSIANLILHLEGNTRQWILCGIANQEDIRERPKEFNSTGGLDRELLLSQLEQTILESVKVVNGVSERSLVLSKNVQGFEESVLSIIIHVIEHMSYHTGQITYYTKMIKNVDTNYYPNVK